MSGADASEGHAGSIHASAVIVGESGIIIRGASGAGKSSLALSLIAAADHTAQFARLVGDDRIELSHHGGRLIARSHPRVCGMVERRGFGILHMEYESAVVVRLVVDILAPEEAPRYPEADDHVTLCGITLARLALLKETSAYESALLVLDRIAQSAAI